MIFNIITLFPEFFATPIETSLLGRARKKGILDYNFINPRDFSADKHRHVDDSPFGGGPGMVMQAAPVAHAIKAIPDTGRILLMSPRGRELDASLAHELAENENLTLICGRYEGIDARISELFPIEEISICPAVLNGGETAALAVIEAVSRFLPGFMGKDESAMDESFANGLLEYPQYTRPEVFEGKAVPEILLNGNHALIARWRRNASLAATLAMRPQLLDNAPMDAEDAKVLAGLPRLRAGRNLSFCLCHHPVRLEKNRIGTSSLTNLDIHDIARISRSYGMGPFYVLTPLDDQLAIMANILSHWRERVDPVEHGDRQRALEHVCAVRDFAELNAAAVKYYGMEPEYMATSANWPAGKKTPMPLATGSVRKICAQRPVVILLGTARGLDLDSLDIKCRMLRPLRYLNENHLSVRSAAAILADRILGDYY